MTAAARGPSPGQTLAIYKALISIDDTGPVGPVAFWEAIPFETRPEVVSIIDSVISKLLAISVTERLGAILRAHKESKS